MCAIHFQKISSKNPFSFQKNKICIARPRWYPESLMGHATYALALVLCLSSGNFYGNVSALLDDDVSSRTIERETQSIQN